MELDGGSKSLAVVGYEAAVLLARTIVAEPDALLLDEPTNHLDIDAIGWLEEFLNRWPSALLFVTHDQAFSKAGDADSINRPGPALRLVLRL
jgi:ATP-binding cassette subfamily F protein uup